MSIIRHAIGLALGIVLSRILLGAGASIVPLIGFTGGFYYATGSADFVTPILSAFFE